MRDGRPIPGATGDALALTGADAGRSIACRVSATNAGGTSTAVSDDVIVAAEELVAPALVPAPPVAQPPPRPVVTRAPRVARRALRLAVLRAPRVMRVGATARLRVRAGPVLGGVVRLQRRAGRRLVTVTAARARRPVVRLSFRLPRAGRHVLRLRYAVAGSPVVTRALVVRAR